MTNLVRAKTVEWTNSLNELREVFWASSKQSKVTRILIQGLACNASLIWASLLDKRADDTYSYVAMNPPYIGNSGKGDIKISSILNDWCEFIDDMRLQRVEIIGHSLGGHIAAHLASELSDLCRGLFLVCSPPRYPYWSVRGFKRRAQLIAEYGGIKPMLTEVIPHSFSDRFISSSPEAVDAFTEMLSSVPPDIYIRYCHEAACSACETSLFALQKPVVFLLGCQDSSVQRDQIMKYVREERGDVVWAIAEAGHNIPIECPGEFYRRLCDASLVFER